MITSMNLKEIKENFNDKYEKAQTTLYNLKEKWLQINNRKYKNLSNKIKNFKIKLNDVATSYIIAGKIKDIQSEIEVSIWGTARPNSNNFNVKGTRLKNSNIVVLYPKRPEILANIQFIGKEYYYVGKDYGKNIYGGSVPIYMYSSKNPYSKTVKKLSRKLENLEKSFNKIKKN